MRSERVFLMDLWEIFLEDNQDPKELLKAIRTKIKSRFTELEESTTITYNRPKTIPAHVGPGEDGYAPPGLAAQSPSMQRLMQQNPDLIPKPPQPVTPAAAQALAARQALLSSAGSEKPENGRKSPRKI